MNNLINFKSFKEINWFDKMFKKEVLIIEDQFLNFPENGYLNLATFHFDLYEYSDCTDYHFLINKLFNKVMNIYQDFKFDSIYCIKKNKLEVLVNDKKYKKAFRVNGSRFDTENLFIFLNSILEKNKMNERFYLLSSSSHIQYPIFTSPELIEKAKALQLIAIL